MADAIHEFSSDGSLSYGDIANGYTIASTTGSQTAVVRDIAVTVPGGKAVEFRVDDVTVAKQSGSGAIGGTLLLKASQALKMFPSDNATWTGMKAMNSSGNNSQFTNTDLVSAADYYNAPLAFDGSTGTRMNFGSKTSFYYTGSSTSVTSKTNGAISTSAITVYWADEQLSKPEGDFYYTEYIDNAESSNGYNHMKYYDSSADTVTEIMDADGSFRNWVGGFSNKYLILRSNSANFGNYKYLDTTTNTVSSNITLKQSNNNSTTYLTIDNGKHYFSALDNYCIFRTTVDGYSSSDKLGIFRISDGKFNYWSTANSDSGTDGPTRNSGSYAWGGFRPALAKNTSGIYYVLWPWAQGTSTSQFGLMIYQLGGAEQIDKIVTSGTFGNPDGLNLVTRWRPAYGGGTDQYYLQDFACSESNTSSKHIGPYNGFRPLKKPTPTDSTSQYWIHCGAPGGNANYVLDLDNVTNDTSSGSADAGGMAYQMKFIFGSAGSTNQAWSSYHGQAETYTPTWKSSLLASAYGTMKQRTTGILST